MVESEGAQPMRQVLKEAFLVAMMVDGRGIERLLDTL